MFSAEEENEIERVNAKHNEISLAIKSLSSSLSELEEISKSKEQLIETNFDQLIFKLKNRKITLLDEFKKISNIKKKLLLKQLGEIKQHQKELNDFKIKYEQMILGESHGMDQIERKKYIISTTKKLLNSNYDSHSRINPLIKIENLNTNKLCENIDSFGIINACNIPYPPNVIIKDIYTTSARIQFNDDTKLNDTPKATEFKIEICNNTSNRKRNGDNDDDKKNNLNEDKWETAMIVDNEESECILRNLLPSCQYLIRVCCWNINGWSGYSKIEYIKTKTLSKIGQRMIYLSPTPQYQNKLSILMTSYFTKWKGFHITIGGRHKAGESNICSSEIAQELSELGEKTSNKKLWKIPNGKWKVLGGKDLIVLGLDDDISIFNVASKFLQSKGWKNVKTKNYHITLGLKKDLNREQIKEMAHILVDKDDPVQWEWVSVKERPDGKIVWDQRYPAYHL